MTTKRHGGDGGSGDGPRPRIKSSHEKVLEAGAKPKAQDQAAKAARGGAASRAAASSAGRASPTRPSESRERARGLRKARGRSTSPPPTATARGASRPSRRAPPATAIAVAALDKKAVGLEILDVAGKVDYADFLVIMTGRSDRHAQALAQGIEEALKKKGVRPVALEGCRTATGCSWTSATSWSTSSRTRRGGSTTSRACGSTRGGCRSRPEQPERLIRAPSQRSM